MKPAYLCPYLVFDGDCKAAMEFYHSVLGGKLVMQTFGEAPMPSDASMKDRIMHAMIENDDLSFMASDTMSDQPHVPGNNVHLSLVGTDEAKLRDAFAKLSDGGTVTLDLAPQFWGDTFGTLTDRFGIHWMVNISGGK